MSFIEAYGKLSEIFPCKRRMLSQMISVGEDGAVVEQHVVYVKEYGVFHGNTLEEAFVDLMVEKQRKELEN